MRWNNDWWWCYVFNQAILGLQAEEPLAPTSTGVQVMGVGDLLTHLAMCCQPVPGDDIIGYVTRGRGVTVHRQDCPNLRKETDEERLIPVSWGETRNLYPVRLGIEAWDRVGLLRDITATVSAEGVNISSVRTEVHEDGTMSSSLTVLVASMAQLSRLFVRLEAVRGITSVVRVTSASAPSSPRGGRSRLRS